MSALRALLLVPAVAIGLPLYLVFMSVFMALWLASVLSCVGPVSHCVCRRRDKKLLAATVAPGGPVQLLPLASGRTLAVRWSPAPTSALPPVCIPNGLGATLITISTLHERLVELGFPVLSYDRAGVGQSAPRLAPGHAGAEEVVGDMREIMDACGGVGAKWVLVGPSMGSIVAQCFIAAHPEMVSGFLNMDGFPFPFAAKRRRFELAAYVYKVYAAIVPTGILRPFLYAASGQFKALASGAFSVPVIRAQMNSAAFFSSLACEMVTMMDCADYARAAWGPAFDLQSMSADALRPLVNTQPHAYGNFKVLGEGGGKGHTWEEQPRSRWEYGAAWTSWADALSVVHAMLEQHMEGKATGGLAVGAHARLPDVWPSLVVRAMSARNFAFPGGESFFDAQMKDYAGAEHNVHVLLAGGKRTGFPTRHHGQMFFGATGIIAQHVVEIADELRDRASS